MNTPTKEYGPHSTSEIFSCYGMNTEELEHVPSRLNREGFSRSDGWEILSALIRFEEAGRCRGLIPETCVGG
jgi:hypothetical protein